MVVVERIKMPIIKKLTISNFRAFKKLELDELSNINVFLGKNNSGKTTMLEALFLMIGMSNPEIVNKITYSRGTTNLDLEHIQSCFYKFDYKNIPEFEAVFNDKEERILKLSPMFSRNKLDIKAQNNDSNSSLSTMSQNLQTDINDIVIGLNFEFSLHEVGKIEKKLKNSIILENSQMLVNMQNSYIEKYKGIFLTSKISDALIAKKYSEILKRNKDGEKDEILKMLKFIEPNIVNIQPLGNSLYFEMSGIEHLVPIDVMGDGIRRILGIYVSILEKHNAFVFIDEVENGLHFLTYEILLKGLFIFAKRHNTQIFMTTHSDEFLKSIKNTNIEDYDKEENIKLFTIVNTEKKGHCVYPLTYTNFIDAKENDIEIRK